MELKPKYNIEYKEVKRGFSTQHIYVVDGVEYPSVSAILGILDDGKSGGLKCWGINIATENIKNALLSKLNQNITINEDLIKELVDIGKNEPDRIKDEACDIGSQCHNSIDCFIKGEKDYEKYLIDERAKRAFNNFMFWFKDNGLEFISGDLPVVSIKHKFGGRLDALAKYKNGIVLLDWKTSNDIRRSYGYQVGGYAIALEETYGIKPKLAYVIKFAKDEFKIVKGEKKEIEQVEEAFVDLKIAKEGFKNLVNMYYINKKELFI